MNRPKVIVSRKWPEEVEGRMQELFDVQLNKTDTPLTAVQMQAALQGADAFCPTVSDNVSAEVLSVDNLHARIIGSYGVGFNHIDLEAAKSRGLVVTNTPQVLTDCTADLAMTLLLMTARRAGEGERHVRNKEWRGWRPTHMMGAKVTGKTLGLIGMGRIARAMAQRAFHGFGMKIIFTDPYPPPDEVVNALQAQARASIEEVLQEADFVSLHCPGGKETWHLLNAERLALMKPGAFLINSARGDVIDQAALIEALDQGVIAGAGLDVYEGEPAVPEQLLSMQNVVLLPHLGSASRETRVAMGMRVVDNLQAFFKGEAPRDRVA
ncbi:MAG: D-glycerate dehydrogenase [Gammaproteobacteria bacterium]|nr:D-glycerate dehydrogenase [Gammaproteobacteria bacterium]MCY4338401.1 D-glycerate dehydrogenase [Gammaproteobacteria bacterium]